MEKKRKVDMFGKDRKEVANVKDVDETETGQKTKAKKTRKEKTRKVDFEKD